MPQRVIVVHSPHSGRSSKLPDAIKHLEQAGLEVDVGMAQPAEQATHPAHPAHPGTPSQSDLVSAGVVPQKQAFFAHALTVGVNVQFARIATNVATRKRFGRMTYPYAALKTAASRDALDIQLEFEGLAMPQATDSPQGAASPTLTPSENHTSLRCRALQVAAINTPIFGGQREFAIAGSSFEDRLLDIVVLEHMDMGAFGKSIARFFAPQAHAEAPLAQGERRTFTHHPAELSGIPGIHQYQAEVSRLRPCMLSFSLSSTPCNESDKVSPTIEAKTFYDRGEGRMATTLLGEGVKLYREIAENNDT